MGLEISVKNHKLECALHTELIPIVSSGLATLICSSTPMRKTDDIFSRHGLDSLHIKRMRCIDLEQSGIQGNTRTTAAVQDAVSIATNTVETERETRAREKARFTFDRVVFVRP